MMRAAIVAGVSLAVPACSPAPLVRDAVMIAVPAGPQTQIGDDHAQFDERPQQQPFAEAQAPTPADRSKTKVLVALELSSQPPERRKELNFVSFLIFLKFLEF